MDKAKVIKGLECIKGDLVLCVDCAYSDENGYGGNHCKAFCANDAITLLKEQEAVKPVRDTIARRFWVCGNCGEYVGFEDDDPFDSKEFDNYCRKCGKPVLWEGR